MLVVRLWIDERERSSERITRSWLEHVHDCCGRLVGMLSWK